MLATLAPFWVSSWFGGEAEAPTARSRAMRAAGPASARARIGGGCRPFPRRCTLSPAVAARRAPAVHGAPQPAQVLGRRGERERSIAPRGSRSRAGCFTPKWRGAPQKRPRTRGRSLWRSTIGRAHLELAACPPRRG